jgi:hypothetical protein
VKARGTCSTGLSRVSSAAYISNGEETTVSLEAEMHTAAEPSRLSWRTKKVSYNFRKSRHTIRNAIEKP